MVVCIRHAFVWGHNGGRGCCEYGPPFGKRARVLEEWLFGLCSVWDGFIKGAIMMWVGRCLNLGFFASFWVAGCVVTSAWQADDGKGRGWRSFRGPRE